MGTQYTIYVLGKIRGGRACHSGRVCAGWDVKICQQWQRPFAWSEAEDIPLYQKTHCLVPFSHEDSN